MNKQIIMDSLEDLMFYLDKMTDKEILIYEKQLEDIYSAADCINKEQRFILEEDLEDN